MEQKKVWKAPAVKKLEIKLTMTGSGGTSDAGFSGKSP